MMQWIWRVGFAALLIAGLALWLPTELANATGVSARPESVTRGPAADDDDHSICYNGNPRKQKKCHYNGWDLDGVAPPVPTDASATGASISDGGLTIDLWRSTNQPSTNMPFLLALAGNGMPVERIWWWADGPDASAPPNDDLARIGVVSYDCGGATSCAQTWTLVPRNVGRYTVHARVHDTSGREVETVWAFWVSSSPGS